MGEVGTVVLFELLLQIREEIKMPETWRKVNTAFPSAIPTPPMPCPACKPMSPIRRSLPAQWG